ncbi:MAG TPA: PAS domain-containing sensor histidine kinase [Kineosporiaceae bacterium]
MWATTNRPARQLLALAVCAAVFAPLAFAAGSWLSQSQVHAHDLERSALRVQGRVAVMDGFIDGTVRGAQTPELPPSVMPVEAGREAAQGLAAQLTAMENTDGRDPEVAIFIGQAREYLRNALLMIDSMTPTAIANGGWRRMTLEIDQTLVAPVRRRLHATMQTVLVSARASARAADARSLWGAGGIGCALIVMLALVRWSGDRGRRLTARRFTSLMSNLRDVIMVLGAEGELVYRTPSPAAGLARVESQTIQALVHPEDQPLMTGVLTSSTDSSAPITVRMPHVDGSYHWWEIKISDLRGNPTVNGFVLTSRDITERREAERALHKLNEELEDRVTRRTAQLEATVHALEQYASSVSHDLRTPLRAIKGFTEILLQDYPEALPPQARQLFMKVVDATERMNMLIDDLLRFSMISHWPLQGRVVDMGTLARSALRQVRDAAPEQPCVDVRVGELRPAWGDESMLRQVWINLLSNALKFTAGKPDGWVEVSSQAAGDEVIYRVRDNGVGFDAADAQYLFSVFKQLHGRAYTGTGIGLAIVYNIVTRHGGRVWAEGEAGKGATFSFALSSHR